MTNTDKQSGLFAAVIGGVLAALISIAAFGIVFTSKARAADKGNQWAGCGFGIHGSGFNAAIDISPINIGTSGYTLGGTVLCDVMLTQTLLVGAYVDYDRIFGDAAKLTGGAPTDLTVGGRAGILVAPTSLVYAHGGRSWMDLANAGTQDGWKLGFGTELKLPTAAPLYLDIRYTRTWFDNVTDAHADAIRLGLTFKLGPDIKAIEPAKYFMPEATSKPLK